MNPSELALQVASDRAAFAAEHQGRGEIAVGEAFVPNEKYDSLDKERLKANVSELRTKVRSTLNEDVGLSDFPSNRDRALVALGNKG